MIYARICGSCQQVTTDTELFQDRYYFGGLKCPDEFVDWPVCNSCFTNLPLVDVKNKIRTHNQSSPYIFVKIFKPKIIMPNGADGSICATCNEFFPYAEANQDNGSYLCPDHRENSI